MADSPGAPRALIVDDHPDSAESLLLLMQLYGVEARALADGAELLESVRRFEPQLVILDINLPGLNGYQLAKLIRAEPQGEKITLAALSGYAGNEHSARALAAGFDVQLSKPLSQDALRSLLSSIGADVGPP